MRVVIILLTIGLVACSSSRSRELPQTSNRDPIVKLNADRWPAGENALIQPPERR